MTKKALNQNGKYVQQLKDTIEPNFIFSNKPLNRFEVVEKDLDISDSNKSSQLTKLKKQIPLHSRKCM